MLFPTYGQTLNFHFLVNSVPCSRVLSNAHGVIGDPPLGVLSRDARGSVACVFQFGVKLLLSLFFQIIVKAATSLENVAHFRALSNIWWYRLLQHLVSSTRAPAQQPSGNSRSANVLHVRGRVDSKDV